MSRYYYDLHIHSCLSPCADNDNTPNNLVGMGVLAGLQIMALTDHNTCRNCPAFFAAAKKHGIIPVAGMELTTELHSIGQYIQQGERTMFETIVDFGSSHHSLTVPYEESNGDGLNFLAGKTVQYVNDSAFLGTVLAHTDGGVPNVLLELKDRSAHSVGYLIYFFELACAISGYVLGVNPFDQPGVEAYKKNMFALLGKPGYEDQKAALEARL